MNCLCLRDVNPATKTIHRNRPKENNSYLSITSIESLSTCVAHIGKFCRHNCFLIPIPYSKRWFVFGKFQGSDGDKKWPSNIRIRCLSQFKEVKISSCGGLSTISFNLLIISCKICVHYTLEFCCDCSTIKLIWIRARRRTADPVLYFLFISYGYC